MPVLPILQLQLRLLFFCATKDELDSLGKGEFFFGLIMALVAGSFHLWNDQTAPWYYRTGLGSLVYLFFLSTFLWVLFALVGAKGLRFGKLFTFLSLTSPLAFLTAIPLNSFLSPYDSELAGVFLTLAIIGWRLGLLAFYIRQTSLLSFKRISVAIFIPLAIISNFLVWSDVIFSSFSHMGGIHREFRKVDLSYDGTPRSGSGSGSGNSHKAKHVHVPESATNWLTAKGRGLAERDDNPFPLKLGANSEPAYQETIMTPSGPVQIYSNWSVGPQQGAPPGFEEVTLNDSLNQYRHPLTKLLKPLALLGAVGIIPALVAYLIFMICRPKDPEESNYDEEEGEQADEGEERDCDDEER